MMTKKEFAQAIIDDYLSLNGPEVVDGQCVMRNEMHDSDVYRDGTVAVAMEFLGLIESIEAKEYAKSKDGISWSRIMPPRSGKCFSYISTRDMLSLLPEDIAT